MDNRKRSEQALCAVVVEAYKNGISTRKIEKLAEAMGIKNISAGEVSEMNKELDELEEKLQNRMLEKVYPVLWADALYENIRED